MSLDKSHDYIFRIGSDVQHRLHWDGNKWQYEFLAGGVLFDQLFCKDEEELEGVVAVHGLTIDRFSIDHQKTGHAYSQEIKEKHSQLTKAGIEPCAKHGLMAKNPDGTCEACENTDYWDDFKGTEGS